MPLTFFCEEALPDVRGFDDCTPNHVFGEIENLLLMPVSVEDNDLSDSVDETNWMDWENWETLIERDPEESLGDGFYAFIVPVRGTLSEPDRTEIEASMYRKAYPPAEWTVECRVDDIPDSIYAALTEMHNTTVRMWFTSGGYIFGGPTGLIVQMNTSPSIEEGRDSMHQYHVKAQYYGDAPARAQIDMGS